MKLWIEDRDIEIQYMNSVGHWKDVIEPIWDVDVKYRLKPADPVPTYKFVYGYEGGSVHITNNHYKSVDDFRARNMSLAFDWAEPVQNTKIMVQP